MRALGTMILIFGGNLTGFSTGSPDHSLVTFLGGLLVILVGGVVIGLAD